MTQLAALHQEIVRIERRYRENAHTRGGQRRDDSSKYPDFRKIKWAMNFHNTPTHTGAQSLRNQSILRNHREFVAGARNRKESPLRGPLRHNGIGSKSANGERFWEQGKFKIG